MIEWGFGKRKEHTAGLSDPVREAAVGWEQKGSVTAFPASTTYMGLNL